MKKLLFIYNPGSGRGRISKNTEKIIGIFKEAGYDVTVRRTAAPLDCRDFIAEHAGEYSLTVAAGGDGTFHELINGLERSGAAVPVGYIPSGTFNDLAASLGIPKDPVKAARVAVSGSYMNIDSGSFNGSLFSYAAAFGLFTETGYETGETLKKALGHIAYYLKVASDMRPSKFEDCSHRISIEADGDIYEDEFIYGLISSSLRVAGAVSVLPRDASMKDGLFDCLFIKTPRTQRDITRLRDSLISRRFDPEISVSLKARELTLAFDRPAKWTLDGEYGGVTDRARLVCLPSSVRIAVPAKE